MRPAVVVIDIADFQIIEAAMMVLIGKQRPQHDLTHRTLGDFHRGREQHHRLQFVPMNGLNDVLLLDRKGIESYGHGCPDPRQKALGMP